MSNDTRSQMWCATAATAGCTYLKTLADPAPEDLGSIRFVHSSISVSSIYVFRPRPRPLRETNTHHRRCYAPSTRADTGVEQDDYFSTLGKAFVGLRLMLDAYPTKKWFVVLGDDNYVLLDNYVNVLSAFDPDQPWALSRMVYRQKFGCKVNL